MLIKKIIWHTSPIVEHCGKPFIRHPLHWLLSRHFFLLECHQRTDRPDVVRPSIEIHGCWWLPCRDRKCGKRNLLVTCITSGGCIWTSGANSPIDPTLNKINILSQIIELTIKLIIKNNFIFELQNFTVPLVYKDVFGRRCRFWIDWNQKENMAILTVTSSNELKVPIWQFIGRHEKCTGMYKTSHRAHNFNFVHKTRF